MAKKPSQENANKTLAADIQRQMAPVWKGLQSGVGIGAASPRSTARIQMQPAFNEVIVPF